MSIEIKGLDNFLHSLEELKQNAEEIDGENRVPFNEMFPDFFMMRNTNFSTIDEMFYKSGFIINKQRDFDDIQVEKLDQFVNENTEFETWDEMKQAAGKEWILRKLRLGDDNE